ncbi:MAG: hypothetical protein AB4063_09480 [Crocosphaera sp.]
MSLFFKLIILLLAMGRVRQKECALCQTSSKVLYRVQIDSSQQWRFVCYQCWQQVHDNNPHYVYGGTWKSRKRH